MPAYRIYRLRDSARQQFRWAAHTIGLSLVKQKDYNADELVESNTPYEAWLLLRSTPDALQPGDILESERGALCIYKYVGFEEARWLISEPKPEEPPVAADLPETPQGVG